MKVEIKETKRVFDGFFKIDEATLQHEKFNGEMSKEIRRLCFDRGNAVAAIVYNKDDDTLIFTRQFRYPVYTKEPKNAYFLEVVAGMIPKDKTPEDTLKSEVMEELGYKINSMRVIDTFYLSPGGSNERIFLYYVEVINKDKTKKGGGLESENEDIQTIAIPKDDILRLLNNFVFDDAKTIIGTQWFLKNKIGNFKHEHKTYNRRNQKYSHSIKKSGC
ncbi:MAG: NUDIX domain-containing protein [Candidatus Hodarchaeota archaeon]